MNTIKTLNYGVVDIRETADPRFDRLIDWIDLSDPSPVEESAQIWVDCDGVVFATLVWEEL